MSDSSSNECFPCPATKDAKHVWGMSMAFRSGCTECGMKKFYYDEPVSSPVKTWRCFHCNEVFTDREKAAEHFGKYEMLAPACTIDVAEYRRMEEVNRQHCSEDTELHRTICRMSADHQVALRREEETGYARGLRDAGLSEKT